MDVWVNVRNNIYYSQCTQISRAQKKITICVKRLKLPNAKCKVTLQFAILTLCVLKKKTLYILRWYFFKITTQNVKTLHFIICSPTNDSLPIQFHVTRILSHVDCSPYDDYKKNSFVLCKKLIAYSKEQDISKTSLTRHPIHSINVAIVWSHYIQLSVNSSLAAIMDRVCMWHFKLTIVLLMKYGN